MRDRHGIAAADGYGNLNSRALLKRRSKQRQFAFPALRRPGKFVYLFLFYLLKKGEKSN
jgi:hypothetical protein